jgi:polyvinyl alcohol dehydrogenase (cytochrome)
MLLPRNARRLWRGAAVALTPALGILLLHAPASAGEHQLNSPSADSWPVFGHDLANSRSAGAGGPSPAAAASLQRAWTFNSSNGDFTGTPVVADGLLVAGTNLGSVYALDAVTGQLRWSLNTGSQINGSAAIDTASPDGPAVFVPIAQVDSPRLLALSLTTGAPLWSTVLSRQSGSDVFGSPTYWDGTVYIGTSGPGNDESTARGSVVALDEASGAVRWQTFTVPPGFDGGGVWSTPAIDTATGRLYVGTGNAYHDPAASTTDSILALSARSGHVLGHFQSTPGDVWELDNPGGGPDYDFGSSPNLILGAAGQALVGEGQKSGTYWALDRSSMQPVWKTSAGPGSQADGGIGSTAYDGSRIYGSDSVDSQVFALQRDGQVAWNSIDGGTLHISPVAAGNGVVYSGDSQGFLTARDAATGAVLTKQPLGGPNFGGISIAGHAVYVAVGTGPPSPVLPLPSSDTSQVDGSGSIVAFGDTSASGTTHAMHAQAETFAGDCQLTGSVTFRPALTTTPQPVDQSVRATGVCSGSFTGADGKTQQLNGAPATYIAAEHAAQASCGAGTDAGSGMIMLPGGSISFTISEVHAGPAVAASAQGAGGGSAAGQANVSPSESPVAVLQACGGSGLAGAPIDIRLATTPSMSG